MSMGKIKTHNAKINRIKFFARKHAELSNFRDGLASSIFIDTQDEDDAAFLSKINSVCIHLENKLLGKE